MAGAISSSGLTSWIAEAVGAATLLPALLMVALVTLVIIFLTEVTSNTATAAAFFAFAGRSGVQSSGRDKSSQGWDSQ
jgi:sodium-dependent dicarboxylate transporter 2/3/5